LPNIEENLDKNTFEEIWELIVKPEIERAIAAGSKAGKIIKQSKSEKQWKNFVFSRYLTEENRFRQNVMLNPKDNMDRHKIAALFYIAFTDKIDGFPFFVFDDNLHRELDADILVTHAIAFDISIGIIESYIISNPNVANSFKDFLCQNGLCDSLESYGENSIESYERQTVKQLIYAFKENKLSPALIANIFYKIENNSKLVFLLRQSKVKV